MKGEKRKRKIKGIGATISGEDGMTLSTMLSIPTIFLTTLEKTLKTQLIRSKRMKRRSPSSLEKFQIDRIIFGRGYSCSSGSSMRGLLEHHGVSSFSLFLAGIFTSIFSGISFGPRATCFSWVIRFTSGFRL